MVAAPGPPRVMIQRMSKAISELIVAMMAMNSRFGFSQGSVIAKKRATGPAPSSIAARCRFPGIDCSPASSSRAVSGAWFQTWVRATRLSARKPSPSQGVARKPRPRSLSSPFSAP